MQTAIDVIRKIVTQNQLSFLNFNTYYPKGWKDGTLKHFKAEKKTGQRRDPQNAVEHTPPNGIFTLGCESVSNEQLFTVLNNRPDTTAIEVISKVCRSTKIAHIPMLDVELAPNDENLSHLICCLRTLGERAGAVLLSGASYHYYGYDLLTPNNWRKFMYLSLLLDEVVNTRWVGHRLIDGHANLRITPKGEYNFIPYMIAEL